MIAPTSEPLSSGTPSLDQNTAPAGGLRAIANEQSPVILLLEKLSKEPLEVPLNQKLWLTGALCLCEALRVKAEASDKLLKGSIGPEHLGTTDVLAIKKFQKVAGEGVIKVSNFYFSPDGTPFKGEITVTDPKGNIARISSSNGRTGAYFNGRSHMEGNESAKAQYIFNIFRTAAIDYLKAE